MRAADSQANLSWSWPPLSLLLVKSHPNMPTVHNKLQALFSTFLARTANRSEDNVSEAWMLLDLRLDALAPLAALARLDCGRYKVVKAWLRPQRTSHQESRAAVATLHSTSITKGYAALSAVSTQGFFQQPCEAGVSVRYMPEVAASQLNKHCQQSIHKVTSEAHAAFARKVLL